MLGVANKNRNITALYAAISPFFVDVPTSDAAPRHAGANESRNRNAAMSCYFRSAPRSPATAVSKTRRRPPVANENRNVWRFCHWEDSALYPSEPSI